MSLISNITIKYTCVDNIYISCPKSFGEDDMSIYIDDVIMPTMPFGSENENGSEFLRGDEDKINDVYLEYEKASVVTNYDEDLVIAFDKNYYNKNKNDELVVYEIIGGMYCISLSNLELQNASNKPQQTIYQIFRSAESNSANKWPIKIKLKYNNVVFESQHYMSLLNYINERRDIFCDNLTTINENDVSLQLPQDVGKHRIPDVKEAKTYFNKSIDCVKKTIQYIIDATCGKNTLSIDEFVDALFEFAQKNSAITLNAPFVIHYNGIKNHFAFRRWVWNTKFYKNAIETYCKSKKIKLTDVKPMSDICSPQGLLKFNPSNKRCFCGFHNSKFGGDNSLSSSDYEICIAFGYNVMNATNKFEKTLTDDELYNIYKESGGTKDKTSPNFILTNSIVNDNTDFWTVLYDDLQKLFGNNVCKKQQINTNDCIKYSSLTLDFTPKADLTNNVSVKKRGDYQLCSSKFNEMNIIIIPALIEFYNENKNNAKEVEENGEVYSIRNLVLMILNKIVKSQDVLEEICDKCGTKSFVQDFPIDEVSDLKDFFINYNIPCRQRDLTKYENDLVKKQSRYIKIISRHIINYDTSDESKQFIQNKFDINEKILNQQNVHNVIDTIAQKVEKRKKYKDFAVCLIYRNIIDIFQDSLSEVINETYISRYTSKILKDKNALLYKIYFNASSGKYKFKEKTDSYADKMLMYDELSSELWEQNDMNKYIENLCNRNKCKITFAYKGSNNKSFQSLRMIINGK